MLLAGGRDRTEWQSSDAVVALFTRLTRRATAVNRLAITMPQVNVTASGIVASFCNQKLLASI